VVAPATGSKTAAGGREPGVGDDVPGGTAAAVGDVDCPATGREGNVAMIDMDVMSATAPRDIEHLIGVPNSSGTADKAAMQRD
jgi:hypothetical protein